MTRVIRHRYQDPLDALWIATAKKMGLSIERSDQSYASYDGKGTLILSDPAGMDLDDCLAQMILHEICHALVQGMQSFGWVDWGLDNETERDTAREHACLRLQAALLHPFGLRETFAPTTDFRTFYDELPADPFEEQKPHERESIVRARAAYARRRRRPVYQHLEEALEKTARLLESLEGLALDPSDSLLATKKPRPARHESGLFLLEKATESTSAHGQSEPTTQCGQCAWSYRDDSERLRCRQAEGALISEDSPSCLHFEARFDCLTCGACCREAYDTVEVEPEDPAVRLHLPLLVERNGGYDLNRRSGRCVCLRGGEPLVPPRPTISGGSEPDDAAERVPPLFMPNAEPFTCSIYETRPQTCRDFTIFSENCMHARRAVGLSR